jgi:mannose-1-phosphate guanylyltransferase
MKTPRGPKQLPVCAVLLAGGRGTRFWPRSRTRTPKQLLSITGRQTMLRETLVRLAPIVPSKNVWIVTNVAQGDAVRREMGRTKDFHILTEPLGRNTAAAIGLAAIHLARAHGDALMAVLPSDSYVANAARYRTLVRAALDLARMPDNLVVLGVPPTRPETGYGYIERGAPSPKRREAAAYAVKRFTEKPTLPLAKKYAASGKYLWNAGMFFWRVSTFLENLRRFLPATHAALLDVSGRIGTPGYDSAVQRMYRRIENISVDYAIMEPATRLSGQPKVLVIPANIGWSDIGSWAAVYELLASKPNTNVSAGPVFTLEAEGNYFWSPGKFVAAIGVRDLVFVETEDAVLLCPRSRSQDVGKIVKWLEDRKLAKLL